MNRSNAYNYILTLLLSLFIDSSTTLAQSVKFGKLTIEDGLSNNDVNTLIQDNLGFLWFGTEDGLNRYDGYNFKIFQHDPEDSNSLSDNAIWSLLCSKSGDIWIGTKAGIVSQFNPVTEKFKHWIPQPKLKDGNSITALYEDTNGDIWIGTRNAGLYKLNPKLNEFNHWNTDNANPNRLSHTSVRSIIQDHLGNIIIGTYNGLNIFNPNQPQDGFKKYFYQLDNQNSLYANQIYNLTKSLINNKIIWVGTPKGLNRFDPEKNFFDRIRIPNAQKLQFGEGASTVIDELIDGEIILWIDTYSGLVRMNLTSNSSQRFQQDDKDFYSIVDNRINKMIKDKSGVIWIATENGISYYSPKNVRFNSPFDERINRYLRIEKNKKNLKAIAQNDEGTTFFGYSNGLISVENKIEKSEVNNYSQFENLNIWTLAFQNDNSLWIGTFGQGLKQFDIKSSKVKDWELIFQKSNNPVVKFVKSLYADSKNNLWIGYWGSGLGRIFLKTGQTFVWNLEIDNQKGLSSGDVWTIAEDRLGRIWVGTSDGGLNLFEDKDGGVFKQWKHDKGNDISLSSDNIYSIIESSISKYDSEEINVILWIATSKGLNQFIVKSKSDNHYDYNVETSSYGYKEGLADNSINSILEDDDGNLWLGTSSGISFFDIKEKYFINFKNGDGINGTVMNMESAIKLDNGLMIFGSDKGMNVFDPKKIELSSFSPPVIITNFQLYNQSVKAGNNSPLKESISFAKEIELKNYEDVFSFEFAALDYNLPKSIKYAYKMEGFDEDWTESGTRRFATYTNLGPGDYIFKVKSTNADGVWNSDVSSIRIMIHPPWWGTIWAYGLYTLLIIVGLLVIRRFEINRTKLRNQLRLKEFEAKKNIDLQQLKSRFFANLSHEFRTPLMLIKGPVERLKNNEDFKSHINEIEMIERNSANLEKLINELLELSQLESSSIPLKAKKVNIVVLLRGIVSQFESIAEQKRIKLIFSTSCEVKIIWVDKDKLEKIVNNLLSNALKFTSSGGQINVELNQSILNNNEILELTIKDTGIGIPEDKLMNIFDRFYQVDATSQKSFGGSGIGLALVKEFIDLHRWEIEVESRQQIGTSFKIKIPTDDYLNEDEKIFYDEDDSKNDHKVLEEKVNHQKIINTDRTETIPSYQAKDKKIILIVDDSADIRNYLSGLLEKEYQISAASNGFEGIKTAIEINPDLIISDIMMPSMDGMEFCQKIKSDWQTSDIPIILLTAKASFENKLEGLEIGADDYLTKPFESRELFVRIKNLIEQRIRIREKLITEQQNASEYENLNIADKEFIEKVSQLVKLNLDKTNFNTDHLAKELFLSRSQLHRKMISITGQAPGEFIRIIKLKHAANLLLEKKLSVTQIAYEIGFSSPAQFTRAFSKQFGCTPTDYLSNKKQ